MCFGKPTAGTGNHKKFENNKLISVFSDQKVTCTQTLQIFDFLWLRKPTIFSISKGYKFWVKESKQQKDFEKGIKLNELL